MRGNVQVSPPFFGAAPPQIRRRKEPTDMTGAKHICPTCEQATKRPEFGLGGPVPPPNIIVNDERGHVLETRVKGVWYYLVYDNKDRVICTTRRRNNPVSGDEILDFYNRVIDPKGRMNEWLRNKPFSPTPPSATT